MAKAKKPKVQPIKKIVVSPGTAGLTVNGKITRARATKNTCLTSAAYTASPACQNAMGIWQKSTDDLEKNQQGKQALLVQLGVLEQQEATCIFAYDEAADGFASTVKATAAGDRAIVVSMGMALRADAVHASDPFTPTGLKIEMLKTKKLPRLAWDVTPGARSYLAQMSASPATEASWSAIYGTGKGRMLPPLVPGQLYVFRVAAIGNDGKPSAWSATVSFSM
jgi:hypothetical protein